MAARFFSDFCSFWLFGSFVPSMTRVLPAGGAPLSCPLMVIWVGVAWYCLSCAAAFATPAPPPALVEPPDELEPLEPLSEPQAATVRASASVAMRAGTPRVWVIDLSSDD